MPRALRPRQVRRDQDDPADAGLRGLLENLFGRASDEAIIRDATYIYASRYDWARLAAAARPVAAAAPQVARLLAEHRDRRPAPLPAVGEGRARHAAAGLRRAAEDLQAHYAKGSTGGETAEDAVEMTMTEFKNLVKDVSA